MYQKSVLLDKSDGWPTKQGITGIPLDKYSIW